MESLPLMLQVALSLLGCALSLYLWGTNTAVTFIVLCTTSFGVIFYLSIVVAGAASVSRPYQTTGFRTLLSATSAVLAAVTACRIVVRCSHTALMFRVNVEYHQPLRSRNRINSFLKSLTYSLLMRSVAGER